MYCTRKISEDLYWVGGNDRRLALFENIFPIPRGVSYNSFVLLDEKTVLFDTVDAAVSRQFLENIAYVLDGRTLDYLVINHMEPDHCSVIEDIVMRYPQVKLIGNAKTFQMVQQFYEFKMEDRVIQRQEGEELSVGKHTLQFFMAPMVHWPEVMVTYDQCSKVLFSADGFGSFGALNGILFNDEVNFDRDWIDDARRYYTNIVGKYGSQMQGLLKKMASLDIQIICPLHGPVWRSNLDYLLEKHQKWSTYEAEEKGVLIAYASMYGNTQNMVEVLEGELAEAGITNTSMYDVSGTHYSYVIADAFKYTNIVLATPTYNGDIYPVMQQLLDDMKALNVQNKTVAIMENGSWGPTAAKKIKESLENMKNMSILENTVTIKSSMKIGDRASVKALAAKIAETL